MSAIFTCTADTSSPAYMYARRLEKVRAAAVEYEVELRKDGKRFRAALAMDLVIAPNAVAFTDAEIRAAIDNEVERRKGI